MEWFRLYAEFATDPKVQSMSEPMQRRLVMLMCLRCSNVLETLQEQDICFALRIDETQLAETKVLFVKKGFVDEDWNLLNWDKRQKPSDSSTARVQKHRAEKKQLLKRECNVTGTAQSREDKKRVDKQHLSSDASGVLDYLNQKAGRRFESTPANTKLILARMKEGATVEQLKAVVDAKVGDWLHDSKMSEYLRPATLFNAEKYGQYAGSLGAARINGHKDDSPFA